MWQRSFVRAILGHRILVLLVTCLVSAVAAVFAARVTLESSIEIWFLEDDPTLVSYREFLDRFGADEFSVIGVFAEDVFAPEVVRAIAEITEKARRVPYAHRVTSLATVKIFEAVDGGVELAPLVREAPASAGDVTALRGRAFDTSWVRGNLVAEDGRATAIFVEMEPEGNDFAAKTEMVDALREAIRGVDAGGAEIVLSGSPVYDEAFFRYSQRDLELFGPLSFVLIVAIVAFVFRRATAILVPLSVVLLAILWIHGLMGALGREVDIVSTMLGPLILAIGVADSIHVLSEYYRQLASGLSRDQAVEESIAGLLVPCFFTSATTAVGLLSLLASDLQPISEFGWLAAVGVLFAFVLSVTLVPVILSVARPPDPAFIDRQRTGPMGRLLARLGDPTPPGSRAVLAASAILVLIVGAGMSRLEVGANPLTYFHENDPVRRDFARIDETLGGSAAVELFVDAPDRGLLEPDHLRRLDGLSEWLESRPGMGRSLSIVDALKEINRTMHHGDPASAVVPESRNLAAQYFLLLEGEEEFDAFVQDDYSTGRITARVSMTRGKEAVEGMEAVETRLAREFSDETLRVEATGFIKLMAEMESYLVDSQIRSFATAFVAITVMMGLLLRSVRLGLFSMIPNLTPIVLGLGLMGYAGIALDPGTVMIASIALGLVVDDSVHFLHRLRSHLGAGADLARAIRETMTETGRPIITTSVVLAAGYSVLGFGSFTPNVYFGTVTAVVILLALVCDLVLLPAALVVIRPRFGGPPQTPTADTPRRTAAG